MAGFVPMSERGYDESRLGEELAFGSASAALYWVHAFCHEPVELELPECGYWLDVSASGVFVMRSAERVALGCFLDGQLTEVSGPVEAE